MADSLCNTPSRGGSPQACAPLRGASPQEARLNAALFHLSAKVQHNFDATKSRTRCKVLTRYIRTMIFYLHFNN